MVIKMSRITPGSVTTWIILLIISVILCVVGISAVIMVPSVLDLFRHEYPSVEFVNAISKNQGLTYLSSFVVSCGVLVALLTYIREKDKQGKELEDRRSGFFFEQAKSGLEEVYDLLKNQNNDRVTWIRAARVLLHSLSLSKQITVSEYNEAYRLLEETIRHKLIGVLSVEDEETGVWSALPPQFFYGIKEWQTIKSLDEAAEIADQDARCQSVSIDTVFQHKRFEALDSRSVVAIYDFLEYPKEYSDPLHAVKIWGIPGDRRYGIEEGAAKFVWHRQQAHAEEMRRFATPGNHTEDPD